MRWLKVGSWDVELAKYYHQQRMTALFWIAAPLVVLISILCLSVWFWFLAMVIKIAVGGVIQ